MFAYPIRTAALAVAAIVGLSACTYPYGSYGGVSVGAGNGYYDPYYSGYGYGAGYGYGGYGYPGYSLAYAPYWGWNDGFYYPGTGYYVYDRHHRRHHWTEAQRRYWQSRRDRAVATGTTSNPVVIRENWNDFNRDRQAVRIKRFQSQQSGAATSQSQTSQPVHLERRHERAVRVERASTEAQATRDSNRVQRAAAREERQATRETRRSEMRAERPSRGNGRGRGSGED